MARSTGATSGRPLQPRFPKERGAPGAGGAVAAAAASAAAKATPAASATTSAAIGAMICSNCANCSKLEAGILVHEFVLHEQGLKFFEPLRVLHEARAHNLMRLCGRTSDCAGRPSDSVCQR